jgi:hypothetical protein
MRSGLPGSADSVLAGSQLGRHVILVDYARFSFLSCEIAELPSA